MTEQRICVVIPARNAAPFIRETLESVLTQQRPPDEVIVVDDGSTDDTAQIVRRFNADGVRVISGPEKGAPAAINCGVENTACQLIAHFDADDIMLPSKLSRQASVLSEADADSVGLVASDLRMFGVDGDDRRSFLEGRPQLQAVAAELAKDGVLRLSPSASAKALSREHCIDVKGIYRRSAWESVGGFSNSYRCAYDMDFVWRVSRKYDVAVVNEVLFRGRRHSGNLSGRDELVATECVRVFESMMDSISDVAARKAIRSRIKRELFSLGYGYRKDLRLWKAFRCYQRAALIR